MKTIFNRTTSAKPVQVIVFYSLLILFSLSAQAQEAMDSETGSNQMESMDTSADQATSTPAPATSDDNTIARAQFTTAIVDREPTDDIATVSSDIGEIYFFTEIVDAQGETYTHRWEYEGQQMAEVTFDIGGPRWRVYSSKSIKPAWTGVWTVTVLDTTGTPLKVSNMEVVAPQPMN
jgi:hypothetical protein